MLWSCFSSKDPGNLGKKNQVASAKKTGLSLDLLARQLTEAYVQSNTKMGN